MRKLFTVFAAIVISIGLHAQANINNYAFSTSNNGSLALDMNANTVDMMTGTTQVIGPSTASAGSGLFNIGFDFYFYGIRYTQISVTSNGLIGLGAALTAGANSFLGGNNRLSITNANGMSATAQGTSATGKVHYKLIGTAPNRTLVVEWLNMSALSTSGTADFTCQMRLYETTGVVEYVYGDMAIGNAGTQTWNIGVSATTTIYQVVNTSTHTAQVNTNYANIYPNGPITDLNSASNGNRRWYRWTPASTTAPGAVNFTNVAWNGMTVNWTDNSADEVGFVLYESHDGGITYNYVTQTAANVTTYNATGLTINTTYIWRVYPLRESLGTFATGTQTTLAVAPTLSGVIPVGNSAPTYQKLTQVAQALNSSIVTGNVVFEMQSDYDGTTGETFPITFNNIVRSGPYTVTIRPAAGATNLVTSGDPGSAIPVITLNGTDSLTFDGRAGGIGTVIEWTFRNTRTAATVGSTFVFQNDATTDTLRYLRIEGQNTAVANATILFSTTTGTLGNSNNVIANNDIRDRSDIASPAPHSAINSSGTAAAPNNGNIIRANTIRNFTVNGVRVTSNSNSWIIGGTSAGQGNNIYQEAARATAFTAIGISAGNTFTVGYNNIYQTAGQNTGAMIGISVTGSGNGHTIRNNSIGGSNANRTGAAMTSIAGATSTGIIVTAGTTTATEVYSNWISNWSVELTGTSGIAVGISVTGGLVNVGTLGGNTIGGAVISGVPSDTVRTSDDNGWLSISGGTVVAENNLISNASYYRDLGDRNCGIYVTGGTVTVRNNIVSTIKGNNTSGNGSTLITMGIYNSATGSIIEGNVVTDIYNFNTAANSVAVKGIFIASSSATVRNNRISNVRAAGTQTAANAPWVHGIYVSTGAAAIYNNYIALGMNVGNDVRVNGITVNATTNPGAAISFNTVYITGTAVGGSNNTFGVNRIGTSGITLRNNLLFNDRTGGTGGHYAIGNTNATPATNWTNTTSNNNYFVATNATQVGLWGTTAQSMAQWITTSTGDVATNANTPASLPASTLFVSPLTGNLKINPAYYLTPSDLESKGVTVAGVTVDIENDVRPGPVGSVNGGGSAPDIGADEFDGTPQGLDVGIATLVGPVTTGCHTNCEVVRVRLRNYSAVALDFAVNPVTISGNVTGPNAVTFTPLVLSSGTLAGNATLDTAISLCYDMSLAGSYVFNASAALTGDGNTANNDLPAVTINISGGTVAALSNGLFCAGDSVTLNASGSTTGGNIQWQSSPDGVTWTNIPSATTPSLTVSPADTTFYRTMSCGLHPSVADTTFPQFVTTPVTTGDTVCGVGNAVLTASGSATLNWYTGPTGGVPVATGSTYTVAVAATDTFYVESVTGSGSATVGAPGNTIGTGLQSTAPQWLIFDVLSPTTLQSMVVYPGAAGTLTLEQRDNTGTTVINSTTVTILAAQINTPVTVNVNWNLTPGTGYRLYRAGTVSLYRNDAGAVYPYTVPGVLSITGNSFSTTYYYWGYNWMISSGCSSSRAMAIATVTSAPAVSVTSSNNICGAGTSTLLATSANSNYDYSWTPAATLNTPVGDSVLASPSADTYYLVTANDSATGCVDTASVLVRWSLPPSIVATVSDDTICANTSVNLNVGSTATNPAIVGTQNIQNTNTTYPAPYGNFYWGSRHQMLVTAADLSAAGLLPGYITALSFEIANINATLPLENFEIKIGETNVGSITTFQAIPMTTVFTQLVYMPTNGVNTHTFQVPFFWDGVSNIIVETCHNNTAFDDNCTFRQSTTAYSSTVYYRADASGVCANNSVTGSIAQRPNMRFWSQSAWDYAWTPTASLDNPAIANPVATPATSTTYIVMVTDSLSGCVSSDTVSVMVNPNPMPMFGPDTSICSNASLLLDGTAGTYAYLWQDSTTNQTFTVNSFGTYDVMVTDTTTGCFGADTILVGINAAPSFTLGADPTVCAGTQVSFSGPSGSYNYLWNTNDTVATITTGTAGSYDLAVTDMMNGCVGRDTVALNVNPLPPVALGADTAVCSADGAITLMGPAGNFAYLWNTTANSQSISVSTSGIYYVTVTDNATSCQSGDTIAITYNVSPSANLGNDTTFCSANGPITLLAPAGPYNYLWNNLSSGMTLQTNTTGTYYVDVTDTLTGCTTADTIMVNVPMTPSFQLNDTALCGTQVTLMGPAGPYNYIWSDSTTAMNNTVTTSGMYSLTVTDSTSGCAFTESANVNINANPIVSATASSTTVCQDDANVILTGTPAGGTFTGTSVTGTQFDPSIGAGSYMVMYNFTDINGCSAADSLTINVSACVGIDEPFVNAGMNVYPNPNSGVFTFTAANQDCQKMTVEIMTVEGQVIQSTQYADVQGNFVQEINLNEFANGTYIMRVITDGAVYTQRIVKQE